MSEGRKREPTPAFQCHPGDILADGNVAQLNLEEFGAYMKVKLYAWGDGLIPDSIERLARRCRVTVEEMEKIWPAVRECFDPAPGYPGYLVDPMLEGEREKNRARREHLLKANASRWKGKGVRGIHMDSAVDVHVDASLASDRSEKSIPVGDTSSVSPQEVRTERQDPSVSLTSAQMGASRTTGAGAPVGGGQGGGKKKREPRKTQAADLMWPVFISVLGGSRAPFPQLSDKRRAKLNALYEEQLYPRRKEIAPGELFRRICEVIKVHPNTSPSRDYQMPESALLNKERRERYTLVALEHPDWQRRDDQKTTRNTAGRAGAGRSEELAGGDEYAHLLQRSAENGARGGQGAG
jgi:uncharacterized protein YdaU (DUF1376 family)